MHLCKLMWLRKMAKLRSCASCPYAAQRWGRCIQHPPPLLALGLLAGHQARRTARSRRASTMGQHNMRTLGLLPRLGLAIAGCAGPQGAGTTDAAATAALPWLGRPCCRQEQGVRCAPDWRPVRSPRWCCSECRRTRQTATGLSQGPDSGLPEVTHMHKLRHFELT